MQQNIEAHQCQATCGIALALNRAVPGKELLKPSGSVKCGEFHRLVEELSPFQERLYFMRLVKAVGQSGAWLAS
jgi:hypothetical protein